MTLRLFNIDSIFEELPEVEQSAETIDLFVAALAFKNFDLIPKRLPFLIECSTSSTVSWSRLIDAAQERFWIREEDEGVAVFFATDHCGCIRTYRFMGDRGIRTLRQGHGWVTLANRQVLYSKLDTPGARAVFEAWHHWTSQSTEKAAQLAEGRSNNTAVQRSLIMASPQGCVVCGSAAVAHANTTLQLAGGGAVLIQIPVCATDLQAARSSPNILTFLAKTFSLSLDLPALIHSEYIPDELIPAIHEYVARELGGTTVPPEKRRRGWELKVILPNNWHWRLRLNSLTDYAYMLFKPGDKKAVYRADSAPDHPDLPFFPHHEHSNPDRKRDVKAPSFLYGVPFLDLKRLRDISEQHCPG